MLETTKQRLKEKHYKDYDTLMKELFGERTKENQLNNQIRQAEQTLLWIRQIMEFSNKYPDGIPFKAFPGGWSFSFGSHKEDAMKELRADQARFERDIALLKSQHKLAIEKQVELENKLKHYPTFIQLLEKRERNA